MAPIVSSCVLNLCYDYWLLSDALENVVNFCVKLMSERFELEIHMRSILAFQLDAKLFLLTNRM
jgi:hypothetical protein